MSSTISILVDYDNVDASYLAGGPVALSKIIVSALATTAAKYSRAHVRLYGGWRTNGALTQAAQKLLPNVRAGSPALVSVPGRTSSVTVSIEMAEGPVGTSARFSETFARERGIRPFRANPNALKACVDILNCGLKSLYSLSHRQPCSCIGCDAVLGDLLVQDEQKMVDTLIVADLAHESLVTKASDVVVVSSDSDIWPGILLALMSGASITHIHPRKSWKTPRHLMQTLNPTLAARYTQSSL